MQKAAARIYGVSRATLGYRLRGGQDWIANETNQLLSPNLEYYLAKVILDLEAAGRAPHRFEVIQMATELSRVV